MNIQSSSIQSNASFMSHPTKIPRTPNTACPITYNLRRRSLINEGVIKKKKISAKSPTHTGTIIQLLPQEDYPTSPQFRLHNNSEGDLCSRRNSHPPSNKNRMPCLSCDTKLLLGEALSLQTPAFILTKVHVTQKALKRIQSTSRLSYRTRQIGR